MSWRTNAWDAAGGGAEFDVVDHQLPDVRIEYLATAPRALCRLRDDELVDVLNLKIGQWPHLFEMEKIPIPAEGDGHLKKRFAWRFKAHRKRRITTS